MHSLYKNTYTSNTPNTFVNLNMIYRRTHILKHVETSIHVDMCISCRQDLRKFYCNTICAMEEIHIHDCGWQGFDKQGNRLHQNTWYIYRIFDRWWQGTSKRIRLWTHIVLSMGRKYSDRGRRTPMGWRNVSYHDGLLASLGHSSWRTRVDKYGRWAHWERKRAYLASSPLCVSLLCLEKGIVRFKYWPVPNGSISSR